MNTSRSRSSAYVVVHGGSEIRHFSFAFGQFAAKNFMLAADQCVSPEVIDRAMFSDGHKPGTRILGNARVRPLLERGNEGVLGEFFRDPDVAYDSSQPGNDAGRLDPPDNINGAMRIA